MATHLTFPPYPVTPGVLRGPDEYATRPLGEVLGPTFPSRPLHPRGHRPGGDPVQNHSAGDHYPFVIAVHESPAYGRRYEVLGPNLGAGWWFTRNEDAEKCARDMKQDWERARRYRQQRTLGDYLANKYDIHDGSEQ